MARPTRCRRPNDSSPLAAAIAAAMVFASLLGGASCSEEGTDSLGGSAAAAARGGSSQGGGAGSVATGGAGAGGVHAGGGNEAGAAGHGAEGGIGVAGAGGFAGGHSAGGSSTGGTSVAGGAGGSGGEGSGGSGGAPLGPPDACGFPSDGVWFEIDYSSAYTSTNPDWTFSPTPGFGEPEWAPSGESWPEVWDLYDNIEVTSDPIGTLAEIGWSGTLQIMLGLATLTSYSHATVCVEGRSVSTSSSVIFDVYNPLNGCGESATMSHDWTVHAVGVELGTCMIPGEDFQALRVEPTGGSSALGLVRLRLTLHDAEY